MSPVRVRKVQADSRISMNDPKGPRMFKRKGLIKLRMFKQDKEG